MLQRSHCLCRAVARRCCCVDLHTVEQVVTHHELSATARIGRRERTERNHPPCSIPDVKLANVFGLRAEVTVRLDIHLPLQAETIEVIDQRTAHESLHGFIEAAELDLLSHRFCIVNFYANLGHSKQSRGHHSRQFGALARFCHEQLRVLCKKVHATPRSVFQKKSCSS